MRKLGRLVFCLIGAAAICVAQDVASIVHGTVTKVDKSHQNGLCEKRRRHGTRCESHRRNDNQGNEGWV